VFPPRYYAPRYFAPRYYPPGAEVVPPCIVGVVLAIQRVISEGMVMAATVAVASVIDRARSAIVAADRARPATVRTAKTRSVTVTISPRTRTAILTRGC
jgi:hypothetical protein